MITKKEGIFDKVRLLIIKEKRFVGEIKKYSKELEKVKEDYEKKMVLGQINTLKKKLKEINDSLGEELEKINLVKTLGENKEVGPLPNRSERGGVLPHDEAGGKKKIEIKKIQKKEFQPKKSGLSSVGGKTYRLKDLHIKGLEKETFRRIGKDKNKKKVKKVKEKDEYAQFASKYFSKFSKSLLGRESFQRFEGDLIKASMNYSPTGYVSLIVLNTIISALIAGFIFLFFLYFDFGAISPYITRAIEPANIRFLKVFWILFILPIGTFLITYIYPSLEKRSAEAKINLELPFATIHMAAISGSMINPIKIFEILVSTHEYPALEKEFTKMLNEINIYGSDFTNALKNSAKNTSSKKLAELFNGLATTINSGGNLPNFFEKRSQTLLFDHKIEREKSIKAAETFMDLYISVVIAAPMILMLLLMMMKISGLGLSMSVGSITLMMVLGVTLVNIFFLAFLHLKRKTE